MDRPTEPVLAAILVGTAADHAERLVGMPSWPRIEWTHDSGHWKEVAQDQPGPYFLNLVIPESSVQLGAVFVERLLVYLAKQSGLPSAAMAPLSPAFVLPCAAMNEEYRASRRLSLQAAMNCISRRALRVATDGVAGVDWSTTGPPVTGDSTVYADYYHGAGYVLRAGHSPDTAMQAMLAVNKDSRDTFGPYYHEYLGHAAQPARMIYESMHRPELYLVRGWVDDVYGCDPHTTFDCDQSFVHDEPLDADPNVASHAIVRKYTPMLAAPKTPPIDEVLRAMRLRSCYVSLGFARHVVSDKWILVEARCYPISVE